MMGKYNVDDIVFMDSNQQKEVSKRVELKTIIKWGAEVWMLMII